MKEHKANISDPRISQSTKSVIILTLVTMALLTVIQEPLNVSFLAWFCLVPWVVATARAKQGLKVAWISYLLGVTYYVVNLWWLMPLTAGGTVGLCLYLAIYFPLCGFILRGVYLYTRLPFTLVLAFIWVGQEFLRAWVMTGFAWFFLAHSQHEQVRLLQVSDLFGAYGLTFLVALVNGLFCDLLLRPLKPPASQHGWLRFRPIPFIVLTTGCVVGALVYGHYRLEQGANRQDTGPLVAVVQDNVPQYVKEQSESSFDIFNRHLAISEAALSGQRQPDLMVWPETMVSNLNREYLNQPTPTDERELRVLQMSRSFEKRLSDLAKTGTALLVGSSSIEDGGPGRRHRFNSAEFFLADGSRWPQRYDKMHLVPFGEVVPFRDSWPWMHRLLNSLTPYDYDYTLDRGTDATVFELDGSGGQTYRFGVAICYEDVMPHVPRKLAALKNGRKRIDFLLNISNEGWYVRSRPDKSIQTTAELSQHLAICKFRAVENRVPIVRAVNMGISAFVGSDGSVQGKGLAGNLAAQVKDREGVAGYLIDRVSLDSRTTVYSKIGDIFAIGCVVVTALLLVFSVIGVVLTRQGAPREKNP